MSPLILTMGAAGILTAYYYHEFNFFIPAVAGCLLYLGGIAGVFLVPRSGIDALALGLVSGGILQLCLLMKYFDPKWFPRPVFVLEATWRTVRSAAGVIGIASVTPMYVILDRACAAGSSPGTLAALGIAANLMTIPSALIVTGLNSALLPAFVRHRHNKTELASLLRHAVLYVTFFLLPATLLLIFWARPVIRLLFASPHFDGDSVTLTSAVLATYSFAIMGITFKDIVSNALVGMNREWIAVGIGLSTLLISGIFKSVEAVRHEPIRIALTTGIAVWIGAVAFAVICSALLPMRWPRIVASDGWKIAIAGFALSLTCLLLNPGAVSFAAGRAYGGIAASCATYGLTIYLLRFRVANLRISTSAARADFRHAETLPDAGRSC
jgi:putative peptidoglycan lipid II flippase